MTTMTEFEDYLESEDESYGEAEQEGEEYVGGMLSSALGGGAPGPLSEHEELEFANRLLEVGSEQELEQFLGDVFKKAVRGVKSFARSSAGRALGGVLKSVAKKALPVVGGAIGSWVAPGVGTAIGTKLGSMASGLFEFENEAAAQELEFEMARRVVRIGATAARNAAAAGHGDPRQIAHRALLAATRRHAPAALPSRRGFRGRRRHLRPRFAYGVPYAAYPYPYAYPVDSANGNGHHEPDDDDQDYETEAAGTGKWVRRGRSIVIYGA